MKLTNHNRKPVIACLALVGILLLGVGLRLIRFTNPPLGQFTTTLQLRSAIIARGMYCQVVSCADPAHRQAAIAMWQNEDVYEPQIFERLVAIAYTVLGGEHLWIFRIYDALFWLIGAVILFDLARRITSIGGALASLSYYATLPFAVIATRSFQSEPLMVMFTILSAYSLYRWAVGRSWKWALLAGVLGGLAILVKVLAVFPVVAIFTALLLARRDLRRVVTDAQVWAIGVFLVVIPSAYYFLMIGQRSGSFFSYWSLSFAGWLVQPRFYISWINLLREIADPWMILVGLLGCLIAQGKGRALLLGWWIGYVIFGMFMPFQITTHDYYSLPVIPIVAVSLAVIAQAILSKVSQQAFAWQALVLGVALLGVAYPAWTARNQLYGNDFRFEARAWEKMDEELPTDGEYISLTQDYGTRLSYYGWREAALWPYSYDLSLKDIRGETRGSFQEIFEQYTLGKRYFLVTEFGELDAQPDLKAELYDHYTVTAKGDGYVLFDLSKPIY